MRNIFQELSAIDIIDPILGRWNTLPSTGKIKLVSSVDLPHSWLHSVHGTDRNCAIGVFYFNTYGFIQRTCRACWKLTFSPVSMKEALETKRIQEELGIPSKVGMENRDFTGNLGGYSAFWYCPIGCGLQEARGLFAKVKGALTEGLKRKVNLVLKRGCTEFERGIGPSDGWDQIAEDLKWNLKEDLCGTLFEDDGGWRNEVPKAVQVNTMLHMIHYAFKHGDKTYVEYTGGKLFPSLVFYHDSIHSNVDFPEVENVRNNSGHEDAQHTHELKPEGSALKSDSVQRPSITVV